MTDLQSVLTRAVTWGSDGDDERACACEASFETTSAPGDEARTTLRVDATACPGGGCLVTAPDCRQTVIGALTERDADSVVVTAGGLEHAYTDESVGLLVAAGRFAERVAHYDERLARRTTRQPLEAAHEATGRAGPVARLAAETGLALGAERIGSGTGYEQALRATAAPPVARCCVTLDPPPDATLLDGWDVPSGAQVRLYDVDGGRRYHLRPAWCLLDDDALDTLESARRLLATGGVSGGSRAVGRAVRRAAGEDEPVERLRGILAQHTTGHGVLDDLFADDHLTDVFVTDPVTENPVRVVVDGDRVETNVHLTPEGASALAARFRRLSGRAFSRASPTLDTTVNAPNGRRIRVAGITPPASTGLGFAFRAHDPSVWTLARLVDCGSISPDAAALVSLAVERGAATLVVGPRGAGKTTMLGALLWELPPTLRAVVVEDTPELPVDSLQEHGRDVQSVHTTLDDDAALTPSAALRAALRLGDGALVVGEVRGEEASTLFEAMRVGAADGAVLGTVHGVGGDAVKARVVSDLGVDERAFGATDLVVTLTAGETRRVACVEEVRQTDDGVHFTSLFDSGRGGAARDEDAASLTATGVVARGESHLVSSLTHPAESYADVREELDRRSSAFARQATLGLTAPDSPEV